MGNGKGIVLATSGEAMMLIGQRITNLREEAGLSKPQLASRAGVARSLINKLEDGSADNPTLDKLQKIATALNVSVAYLIGEGYAIPEKLRSLALQSGLTYRELDILVLMNFEGKESITTEEWNHLLHAAKEFPELYKRLGKVKKKPASHETDKYSKDALFEKLGFPRTP